jgi:hypothetical protein
MTINLDKFTAGRVAVAAKILNVSCAEIVKRCVHQVEADGLRDRTVTHHERWRREMGNGRRRKNLPVGCQ